MANQWVRLWLDMPNDPKWRTVARVSKQPIALVIGVFIHLLCDAANATERGRTQPNAEDLASALDVETKDIEAVLEAMQGRVLDGCVLTGWDKRQPAREDGSAERSKAWREEKKSERNRTQPNATERPDKDTEKDKDKDVTPPISPPSANGGRFDAAQMIVPDSVPADVWHDLVAHRREIRKPLTERAARMMAKKLGAMATRGVDLRAAVEQTITARWTDVYEPKQQQPTQQIDWHCRDY